MCLIKARTRKIQKGSTTDKKQLDILLCELFAPDGGGINFTGLREKDSHVKHKQNHSEIDFKM